MSAEPAAGADAPNPAPQAEEDKMAAEWAAALAETKPEAGTAVAAAADNATPAAFATFGAGAAPAAPNDINMILDIPVQLTVELGRVRGGPEPQDAIAAARAEWEQVKSQWK
jgi:flagellar motor switch protein FliN/FliY